MSTPDMAQRPEELFDEVVRDRVHDIVQSLSGDELFNLYATVRSLL
jgi:hypothetical protein